MAVETSTAFGIQFNEDDIRARAGDNGYQKGKKYFQQGRVSNGLVDAALLEATVTGSQEYRTSLSAQNGRMAAYCSCPAGKRKDKLCSHVAALMIAWLEKPSTFELRATNRQMLQEIKTNLPSSPQKKKEVATRAELVANGLDTLDLLLTELTRTGLTAVTDHQLKTLSDLVKTVRAQKLHKLARLLEGLQVEIRRILQAKNSFDQAHYADILCNLWFTVRATRRFLELGAFETESVIAAADRREVEDLLGRTWRENELEPLTARKLIELGYESYDTDTGFHWIVSIFIDPATGEFFQQRESMRSVDYKPAQARPPYPLPLLLQEGLAYPGYPPARIKIRDYRLAPIWTFHDIVQILQHADTSLEKVMHRYSQLLRDPLREPVVYALVRPAQISSVASSEGQSRLLLIDNHGVGVPVVAQAQTHLAQTLQRGLVDAVFGKLLPASGDSSPVAFFPLSIIRSALPNTPLMLTNPLIQQVG